MEFGSLRHRAEDVHVVAPAGLAALLEYGASVVARSHRAVQRSRLLQEELRKLVLTCSPKGDPRLHGGSDALPADAPTRERPLILVADDDVDHADMLGFFLRLAGYTVQLAHDGRDAVDKALSLRPAAIVMDLEMPKLNGWQAIGSLRAHGHTASIPVIVLTGHRLSTSLETTAREVGAQCFLTKPCDPARIASEIEARLRDAPRL